MTQCFQKPRAAHLNIPLADSKRQSHHLHTGICDTTNKEDPQFNCCCHNSLQQTSSSCSSYLRQWAPNLLEDFIRHSKYYIKNRKNARREKIYYFLNIITKRKKSAKKPLWAEHWYCWYCYCVSKQRTFNAEQTGGDKSSSYGLMVSPGYQPNMETRSNHHWKAAASKHFCFHNTLQKHGEAPLGAVSGMKSDDFSNIKESL